MHRLGSQSNSFRHPLIICHQFQLDGLLHMFIGDYYNQCTIRSFKSTCLKMMKHENMYIDVLIFYVMYYKNSICIISCHFIMDSECLFWEKLAKMSKSIVHWIFVKFIISFIDNYWGIHIIVCPIWTSIHIQSYKKS